MNKVFLPFFYIWCLSTVYFWNIIYFYLKITSACKAYSFMCWLSGFMLLNFSVQTHKLENNENLIYNRLKIISQKFFHKNSKWRHQKYSNHQLYEVSFCPHTDVLWVIQNFLFKLLIKKCCWFSIFCQWWKFLEL